MPELSLFDTLIPFLLLLTAGGFWSVYGLRPEMRSSLWFALSFLCGAIAFAVEFLRFVIPDVAQAVFGVSFYAAMAAFFVFGLVARANVRPPYHLVSAIAFAGSIAVSALAAIDAHVLLRICIAQFSAAIMLYIGLTYSRGRFQTLTDKAVITIVSLMFVLLLSQPAIVGYVAGLPSTADEYDTSTLFLTMGFMTTVGAILCAGLLVREAITLIVEDLRNLANRDELTGILNRRGFESAVRELLRTVQSEPETIAVLAIDIDHFKRLNDRYGHGFGDTVIQSLGQMLRAHQGENGLAARIGGEEFVLALRVFRLEEAEAIAGLIRERWSRQTFYVNDQDISSTASFGVSLHKMDETILSTMARADDALYRSKQTGRNKISSEEDLKHPIRNHALEQNPEGGLIGAASALKLSG